MRSPSGPGHHPRSACSARSNGATSAFCGSRPPIRWSASRTWTGTAARRPRPDRFIVVSEAYPTPTTDVADVVLPAAMWIEREGIFANAERRAQHWDRLVEPPGDAASDAWLMIEVARRLGRGAALPVGAGSGMSSRSGRNTAASMQAPATAVAPLPVLRASARGAVALSNAGARPSGGTTPSRTLRPTRTRRVRFLRPSRSPRLDLAQTLISRRRKSPDQAYPFWLGTARCSSTAAPGH